MDLCAIQESRHAKGPRPRSQWRYNKRNTYTVIDTVVEESSGELMVVVTREETQEEMICPLELWKEAKLVLTENLDTDHWVERPKVGTNWRHYKGGSYRIVTNAFHVVTGQHFVIYKCQTKGYLWARDIKAWTDTVTKDSGREVARFSLVG